MRPDAPTPPFLRLAQAQALPQRDGAAARVARTPHDARPAPLRAGDPRWVFAVRAAGKLEGGTRAVLTPENRERLHKDAKALGVRPFDASLIIAIVQDAARSGLPALGSDAAAKIALTRDPALDARHTTSHDTAALAIATLALLVALLAVAVSML